MNVQQSNTSSQQPTTPQPAWHLRYPGAIPDRVLVERAATNDPDDLHIVGSGPRDYVHGRWGHLLYRSRDEALATTIVEQEVKVRDLENALAWDREHLATLRAMTAPGQHPDQSASANTTVGTTAPSDEQQEE